MPKTKTIIKKSENYQKVIKRLETQTEKVTKLPAPEDIVEDIVVSNLLFYIILFIDFVMNNFYLKTSGLLELTGAPLAPLSLSLLNQNLFKKSIDSI